MPPTPPAEKREPRRRHGRVRRWVVRPFVWGLVLLLCVLAGSLLLLQSRFARQQALARIVAQMTALLGRPILIGDIDYTFFPIAVELRDVVIPGPRPSDPPVARVPFVRLIMSVKDLRGRVFDLQQIDIEDPDIYLQVNPDGTNNFPHFRTGRGGPKRFDVRIGHVLIRNGVFRFNERKLPLQLDARAIWGRLIGRAERNGQGGNRLDGLVTAQEVVTTLPRARPYRFTVSAKGSIVPEEGRVRIAGARIAGPDLSSRVSGFVDYRSENRRVELNIDADGAAQFANRLGYMERPIEGPVSARARFVWTPAGWSYSGTATSPRIATYDRVFTDLQAAFIGGPEHLDVNVERSRYAQGTVSGLVSIDTARKGPGTPVALDLDYAGLALHQLIADEFPGEELAIVGGLSGRAHGTLEYRCNSEEPLAGTGHADVHLQGTTETGLPVTGDLPIDLDRGVISGRDLHLTAPGQDVTSTGFTYDLDRATGHLDFRLASRDVGPLGPVLAGPPKRGEEPDFWLPTAGQGTAQGSMDFARKDYSLRLLFDLQNAVAPVTSADAVHGSLALTPRAVDDLRLELTRSGGALMLTGRIPLAEPGRAAASQPMTLAIDAAQWPAGGLAWFLGPELTQKFQGVLSGRLDLSGTPDRLNGRLDARVEDLTAYGVPLGLARAALVFDGGHVTVEQGQIEMPAGTVFAQGSYDQGTEALSLLLRAPALALSAEPFARYLGGELGGRMSLEASASGTLREPRATVSVRGQDLVFQGRNLGQQGETAVEATWDGRRVDILGSLLGLASFRGGGRLDRQGADISIDLRSEQLGVLARALSPQPLPDFSGSVAGTAGLTADFGAAVWRVPVRLSDLRLQYQGHAIANREPVVAELTGERAKIDSFYLGEAGTDNELIVHGTVGLLQRAPLDLFFQSTLTATWAGLFLPEDFHPEGAVDLLGRLRGTLSNPVLTGEGELRGGRLIVPDFAQSIEDINGVVDFSSNRISIEVPHARMGNNGTVHASGTVVLPAPGRKLSYEFTARADNVSLRYPEYLNNRGSAVITLTSTDGGRKLEGTVNLERSLYVEDIPVDLLQFIQRLFQRQPLELAETNELQASTQLSLAIRGNDALRVRNNVANLQGDVRLTVQGTLARPAIFGEVEIDPGGTLVFNDNRYEVQRGTLTFDNPNRIDPVLDLVATTEIQRFNITLNLGGTLERPDVNFSSDANLADLEIVSLIATGQRPTEGPLPANPAEEELAPNLVARQFLYGQAATAITQRVGNIFRLDRFRIDPIVEAGQPVSGIGVTVGKRLSRDIFVTYSTEPGTNRQYIVQIEWQVRKNVVLVLTQAGDGSYAVDAQWQRRF